ncbi:MAG: hypothetical protein ABR562_09565, partial [Thermoplasmatota archaeon]
DQVGGERLDVSLEDPADADRAIGALADIGDGRPTCEAEVVHVPIRRRSGVIAQAVRQLDDADVGIDDISIRRPTLDDVFIALTGHAAEEEVPEEEQEKEAAADVVIRNDRSIGDLEAEVETLQTQADELKEMAGGQPARIVLLAELTKLNAETAEHLNGQLANAVASGNSAVTGSQQKKRDVEKKLQDAINLAGTTPPTLEVLYN